MTDGRVLDNCINGKHDNNHNNGRSHDHDNTNDSNIDKNIPVHQNLSAV